MSETDVNGNTSYGDGALAANAGSDNTAFGENAACSTTATTNTAVGVSALLSNTTGNTNTAIGALSLSQYEGNQSQQNTAIGVNSGQLYSEVTTNFSQINTLGNTFIGFQSGIYYDKVKGSEITASTAIGINSLITKSNQIMMGNSGNNTEVTIPGFLDVSGNSYFRNNLDVSGNLTIEKNLKVTGASTLRGNVAINKNTTNYTLDVSGNIQATNMYVTGFNSSDTSSSVVCPKSYVQTLFNSAVSGVVVKPSCSCATINYIQGTYTNNTTIFPNPSLTTIDGFPLTKNDRILVKDGVKTPTDASANPVANGIYVYDSSSVLLRANDLLYNSNANQISTLVLYGVTNAKTSFLQTTTPATTGKTALDFIPINVIDFNTGPTLILNGSTLSVNPNLDLTSLDVSNNVIIDGSLTLTGRSTSTKTSGSATGNYYSLDVSGTIYSQDLLIQGYKGDNAYIRNTALSKSLYLGANNQNYVSIYNDGTLGRMDVSGCLTIKASGGSNWLTNGLLIYNSTNLTGQDAICTMRAGGALAGDSYNVYTAADSNYGWCSGLKTNDQSYRIATGYQGLSDAITKLTITTNGNVGIGTTSPSASLYVYQSNSSFGSVASRISKNFGTENYLASNYGTENGWQHGGQLEIFNSTNKACLSIALSSDNLGIIQAKQVDVGYSSLLLNPLAGNVGIGTTNPGYTLHVNGSAYATSLYTSGSIHLGDGAGATGQNGESVAIGTNAGSDQGSKSVAIGYVAGQKSQGNQSVAIGWSAGNTGQQNNGVAIGSIAGASNQGTDSVAIGTYAGYENQGYQSVAIGYVAGQTNQLSNSVAIGQQAGYNSQGGSSVAIGSQAGQLGQGNASVAIGYVAGQTNQLSNSVAIGQQAGASNQGYQSVAIGTYAGQTSQQNNSVAIGTNTGQTTQGYQSVAIGHYSGNDNQKNYSVAVGNQCGQIKQDDRAVAIGHVSGYENQGNQSVAIGYVAGKTNQQPNSVAIGTSAGQNSQGGSSVAIGSQAGQLGQGNASVAIGGLAGYNYTTGPYNTMIGYGAGYDEGGNVTRTQEGNTFIGALTNANGYHSYSTAIGYAAQVTASNQIVLGNSSENVYIPGKLGINTSTPGYSLDVNGDMKLAGRLTTGLGQTGYPIVSTDVGSGYIYRMTRANEKDYIEVAFYEKFVALYYSASDIKLKRNIEDTKITDACSSIKQLHFVSYIMKESGKFHDLGVIAQQIETIRPNFVLDVKQPDDSVTKQLNTGEMTIFNMKATQELINRVEVLEKENELLHSRLDELEAFIKNKINK